MGSVLVATTIKAATLFLVSAVLVLGCSDWTEGGYKTGDSGGSEYVDSARQEEDLGADAKGNSDNGDTTLPDVDFDTSNRDDSLFEVDADISDVIETVGIVSWSTSKTILSAKVVFGPVDGEFEFVALVDAPLTANRTLLLGMKPSSTYKFVVVVEDEEGDEYVSDEYELTTGPQRTGLPTLDIDDYGGDVYEGFTITCTMSIGGAEESSSRDNGSFAFIFDTDGDMVWWYALTGDISECSRARMSYDGQYMWTGNINVLGSAGALFRVSMDGFEHEMFNITKRHHDFAVLENGNILYFERKNEGGALVDGSPNDKDPPDYIRELDPKTGVRFDVYYQNQDFKSLINTWGSHTNAINFIPHRNAISFSMANIDTIAVVSYPDGRLLETFGGSKSDYSNMNWDRQHHHDLLEDSIFLFNNLGSNGGASVLKYNIDGSFAEQVLKYAPGIASQTFGDVKQLPNGNILVTFSNAGTIHETDTRGELIRSIDTSQIGYVVRRRTLYGPPPPFSD